LASMTKVSEQFAAGGCTADTVQSSTLVNGGDLTTINDVANAAACGTACCGNASCNGYTYNSQNKNCHLKSGTITTAPGSSNFSGAKVTRTPAEKPASVENPPPGGSVDRPGSSTPAAASPPTTPTPAETAPPKPVMSCNIENFASY
jgi:hypothetical protein